MDTTHWVRPSLLFEGALEGVEEVSQTEGADGASRDGIPGSGEDGVDEAVVLPAVLAGDDLTRSLCGRQNVCTYSVIHLLCEYWTGQSMTSGRELSRDNKH